MSGSDDDGIDIDLATRAGTPTTSPSEDLGAAPTRRRPPTQTIPVSLASAMSSSLSSTEGSGKSIAPLGRLGRYVLEKPLGRGGMAEVFLARQEGPSGFSKRVVLKRIHRALLGEERFVQMFLREARIAARLNHTNLVQVFELGDDGDEYFLAMEHIDGITLQKAARRAWAKGESVPMEVALRAVADAARGLHYAHTLRDDDDRDISLIHRDISPDNLMLTRDGVTKVLDFGVAKTRDGDPMTTDGELKGKIPYMSPEQIRGDHLDGRSDLWSLGITLYWLLTGERPFPSKNELAALHAIVHNDPRPPRELNPLIPLPLQTLLLQLLAKNRDERLSTGAELAERLLSLLGPAAAGPESAEFARHTLALPDVTNAAARTETMAAARPHTAWLTKVADEGTANAPPATEHRVDPAAVLPAAVLPAVAPVAIPATELVREHHHDEERPRAVRTSVALGVALGGAAIVAGIGLFALRGDPPASVPTTTPVVTAATTPAANTTTTATATPTTADVATTSPTTASTAAPATTTPTATTKAPPRPPPNLQVSGPASVRWETLRGEKLGTGTAGVLVAPGTTQIVAVDTARNGRVVVDVTPGGSVAWDALPRGRVDVRVEPYADVVIGQEKLGTTPLAPVALVAGRYTITLVYEGQRIEKAVDVVAGRDVRITHRF